jgi:hypothetical protein
VGRRLRRERLDGVAATEIFVVTRSDWRIFRELTRRKKCRSKMEVSSLGLKLDWGSCLAEGNVHGSRLCCGGGGWLCFACHEVRVAYV